MFITDVYPGVFLNQLATSSHFFTTSHKNWRYKMTLKMLQKNTIVLYPINFECVLSL